MKAEYLKLNTNNNSFNEYIVKNHLKFIVLSILLKKAMSGYDLIKNIFTKYGVLLSQGTIYSLLYSLKEEGIINADFKKGDMRTKRYFTNPEEKQIIEERIAEFIEMEEHILNLIRRG